MTDVAITTAAEPDGAPRIAVLDIMRGVAILAILFMNINDMGQSMVASSQDIRHLGWAASDQVAWGLREVFANGTARGLLEMLFGAGMVILTERIAARADERVVMRRYFLRNIVLFLFGLIHVFILLWPGDILHTYGLAALVAFLFRRLDARWLLMVGLNLAAVQLVFGGIGYGVTTYAETAARHAAAKRDAGQPLTGQDEALLKAAAGRAARSARIARESTAAIASEDRGRKGTSRTWVAAQWGAFIDLEARYFEVPFVWEAASTMLIGAALFKLGILQGRRSRGFYAGMAAIAYAVGSVLRTYAAHEMALFDDAPHTFWFDGELSRLTMTLGHVGLINLLAASAGGAALLRPFVAAGRTALSLYVAQTLVCLWVLYPPFALAWYGRMTWAPLMATAFLVDAALLVGANIWMRRFDIAPVEWAWRSLVERRTLPWHGARPAVGASAGDPLRA